MNLRRLAAVLTPAWAALFGLALLLFGSVSPLELEAAAGVSLGGAVAAAATASLARVPWPPRAVRGALGVPLRVPVDFGILVAALGRAAIERRVPRGSFREKPLRGGRSAGYRALLGAAAGYTPNAYVVEIDAGRRRVLVHDLVPSERSERPA